MTTKSNSRPVFIAALPREIAGLVNDRAAGWQSDDALSGRNIHAYWNDYALIACAENFAVYWQPPAEVVAAGGG